MAGHRIGVFDDVSKALNSWEAEGQTLTLEDGNQRREDGRAGGRIAAIDLQLGTAKVHPEADQAAEEDVTGAGDLEPTIGREEDALEFVGTAGELE